MSLLGLDVGTTGCKATVFSVAGEQLAQARREYRLYSPAPGFAELNPTEVWTAIQECVREAAGRVADPVRAIGVASQGEAAVPVNARGEPLANAPVSFDVRAEEQSRWWAECFGADRVFAITGQNLHTMYTVPKIMWLRDNQPHVFQQAVKFLCFEEYILFKLGVEPKTDYSLAARTMAFDVHAKTWSREILGAAGLDSSLFAEVVPAGTTVGELPDAVAESLGLAPGVVAVTGGHDQPCGALGAGVVSPGAAMYSTGATECITPALPAFESQLGRAGFPCYPHVVPDTFVTLGFHFCGGALLRWYRDTFADSEWIEARRSGRDVYDVIVEGMSPSPSELFVLPHFAGAGTPFMNPRAKGAIFGATLNTTKSDLVRAILEATAFEIALILDMMTEAGVMVSELRAIGGGARSRAWTQIKANITNRPVRTLSVTEAVGLGAALLAGVATGEYASLAEAAAIAVKTREVIAPQPDQAAFYRERMRTYRQLYPAMQQLGLS